MRRHRGDLLIEVLVAIGVFAACAVLLLVLARESLEAMERADRRARALDLARSAIARYEIGEINLSDLRAGRAAPDGAAAWREEEDFVVEFSAQRTPWPGLVLAEVRVRDGAAPSDRAPLSTLRQLVRARRGAEAADEPIDGTALPDRSGADGDAS